ncbi:hypothetical protein DV735_g2235, partial [Chaetothyriales sp. CBS 134920]
MFGLVANLISSVTTTLLPAYLSYKALRTRDPAQINPWLIYFTILSLALLAESWTYFIISWIPFYSWLRLIFLLYLVLPQTQGAKLIYLDYVEPYIVHHEAQIDHFISEAHARLQGLGLGYVSNLAEFLRDKVLGQQNPDLLSRFAMPQAQTGGGIGGGAAQSSGAGFYGGVLSGLAAGGAAAFGAASAGSGGGRSRDISLEAAGISNSHAQDFFARDAGGSAQDRSARISAERERLSGILKQSEQSFERIDGYGPVDTNAQTTSRSVTDQQASRRSTSGSNWVPSAVTGWLGGGGTPTATGPSDSSSGGGGGNTASRGWSAARDITEAVVSSHGSSTGVDRGGR